MASPAETARCARSAAKRMVWRSWPARKELASCGVSAATARNSNGPSRRNRTETRRVRNSSRRRSASASMTAATSGVPCRAVATSARISVRRCSSRETSPSRVASSRLPSCPARMVALAARSSLKNASSESCINVDRADDFIEDHQWSGHEMSGPQTDAAQEMWLTCTRLTKIVRRCGRPRRYALCLEKQPDADEMLRQLAIRLFADQFVAWRAAARNTRR